MMIGWLKRRAGAAGAAAMVLALWLWPAASGAAVEWAGFAGNAQHTATARTPAQPFHRIRWRATVDLAPDLFGWRSAHPLRLPDDHGGQHGAGPDSCQ